LLPEGSLPELYLSGLLTSLCRAPRGKGGLPAIWTYFQATAAFPAQPQTKLQMLHQLGQKP
jgi:hypothetical protein